MLSQLERRQMPAITSSGPAKALVFIVCSITASEVSRASPLTDAMCDLAVDTVQGTLQNPRKLIP